MNYTLQLKSFRIQDQLFELFAPDADAVQQDYRINNIPFPYWSRVWPSAIALSRFLLSHPQYTNNKTVLELGAGLGLPSIVAAGNAIKVISSDNVPEAISIIQQSATHNGLQNLLVQLLDWNMLPENFETDVLLLSDVNYDPALFEIQQKFILWFLQKGTTVILSTPQRLMAKDFVEWLLPYCVLQEEAVEDFGERNVVVVVMVLKDGRLVV